MSNSPDIRAFLAVDVNRELIGRIREIQEEIKLAEAPVKFVEPENLHFTLKFFGDVNEEKLDEINKIIVEKIENFSPFEISISGLGVFPSLRYIRVLWLGSENFEQFSNIQRELDLEFIKIGFEKERSYIPHLTIGRLKGAENKEIIVEKIKQLTDVEIGRTLIDTLCLKKSELTPLGPIYTDLEVFKL